VRSAVEQRRIDRTKPGAEVPRLVLLTTHLPTRRSAGGKALRAAGPELFFDAMTILDEHEGAARLRQYAAGGCDGPLEGFWSEAELC